MLILTVGTFKTASDKYLASNYHLALSVSKWLIFYDKKYITFRERFSLPLWMATVHAPVMYCGGVIMILNHLYTFTLFIFISDYTSHQIHFYLFLSLRLFQLFIASPPLVTCLSTSMNFIERLLSFNIHLHFPALLYLLIQYSTSYRPPSYELQIFSPMLLPYRIQSLSGCTSCTGNTSPVCTFLHLVCHPVLLFFFFCKMGIFIYDICILITKSIVLYLPFYISLSNILTSHHLIPSVYFSMPIEMCCIHHSSVSIPSITSNSFKISSFSIMHPRCIAFALIVFIITHSISRFKFITVSTTVIINCMV